MKNTWCRVICVRDVYDPWDEPALAFVDGESYRAYEFEDGHWEVHSKETHHAIDFTADEFNKCFRKAVYLEVELCLNLEI